VFPSTAGGIEQRAYYLVALKCKEKVISGPGQTPKKHLFVQACTKPKPEECIDFTDEELRPFCDWPATVS
jgi:hypothetical protein